MRKEYVIRRELMTAGGRHDWDTCNALERELEEAQKARLAELEKELMRTAEKALEVTGRIRRQITEPVVEVVERRWVARRNLVFEDRGKVIRWFEIYFDQEEGYVFEEADLVCETCRHWNPKIDFDAETAGDCAEARARDAHGALVMHDFSCALWDGSAGPRPPRKAVP